MGLRNRSREEWATLYSASRQHAVNRVCHTVGIPLIAIAVPFNPVAVWRPIWWRIVGGLFVVGWIFQFVGHAFERKPPEFFKDWRFLFVGLRWWFAKIARKV